MALASDIRSTETGLAQIVATLREGLARRKVYRQTLAELRSLSDRELSDLGMHRSMLTRIALEAAYGR
ncbi:DUF1127 domain-containing protein [Rhodobacter lacus]|uniref:DUF1127 domain-containing protein n=1 Tax=Rhodobacter lacus TaxID=1641972 RepID=A0ABW5A9S6_9RHOB